MKDRKGRPRGGPPPEPRRGGGEGLVSLYGYHPVREALRSSRRVVERLWLTAAAAEKLAPEIAARGLKPHILPVEEIGRRVRADAVHQGIVAEARPLPAADLSDIPEDALVVVLDQVTDPHNVGAILRSAAAFGAQALVTTERHSPDFAGVLAKAASGALEHVAIVSVVNLARAMGELGDMGFLRLGLDSEAPAVIGDVALSRPLALALGAEGRGLRRLTRENCDALARLDTSGPIRSLNVSNAAAVALALVSERLRAPSL